MCGRERERSRGAALLPVVEMHLAANRPSCLASEGPERGVTFGLGSTNRQADPAVIAEMRRSALHASFDEEPVVDLDSEAVDFRVASELFVGNDGSVDPISRAWG